MAISLSLQPLKADHCSLMEDKWSSESLCALLSTSHNHDSTRSRRWHSDSPRSQRLLLARVSSQPESLLGSLTALVGANVHSLDV